MFKSYKVLTVAVLALCTAFLAFGQEEEGEGGLDFGLVIGIGAETFEEDDESVTYQMLRVSPDIAIGKFGIGLELTVHYSFAPDFQVRREDWVPTGDDTVLDVYLPKFKYVRYGFKGDPLFVKLGSIEDALLGNGFIMGGYDNTLFLPEKRIFGLSFDLDGTLFNFPYVGIETFVGNLAQFDVMGFRSFVRPLASTEIPVIKGLQVGATVAFDRKPGLYVGDDDAEPVILYGADLTLPVLVKPMFTLTTFGDIAVLHNRKSLGGMVGVGGRLVRFINYGAQIRILGQNFVPTYFDSAYDLFRYEKYQIVQAGGIDSYVGWLGSLGFTFLDDALRFNASVDGPFNQPGGGDPNNYLDWPHLYAEFVLGEGIIPNLSLQASWDKRLITEFRDLFNPEDAVIGARLNYKIGVAVLSFIYQIRYEPGPPATWETRSGIESAIQLF